jgi:glycogen debranching enzyme
MGVCGYTQTYVDQFDADTTVITRHNPLTYESFILIARTAFSQPNSYQIEHSTLDKSLFIPGKVQSIPYQMNMRQKPNRAEYKRSDTSLNGIENFEVVIDENSSLNQSRFIERIDYNDSACSSTVHFKYFPPSTVIIFKCSLNENLLGALTSMKLKMNSQEIDQVIERLNFDELNIILYRCENEEQSDIKSGTYGLSKHGALVYAGLQGVINILEHERLPNNLGHEMFDNLRNGDWLMNYLCDRLRKYANLQPQHRKNLARFADLLSSVFALVAKIPRYLIPRYFDLIITNFYAKLIERCFNLMNSSNLISHGSSFVKSLALGSVSLVGHVDECELPDTILGTNDGLKLSLSAGLPHFSSSYMRNWGRDTFISLRGLLLLTGRFEEAKNLILAYGGTMRHGLIPNLLADGKFSRYNCRDAVWFWLKSIRGI